MTVKLSRYIFRKIKGRIVPIRKGTSITKGISGGALRRKKAIEKNVKNASKLLKKVNKLANDENISKISTLRTKLFTIKSSKKGIPHGSKKIRQTLKDAKLFIKKYKR